METKVCTRCGKELSLDSFFPVKKGGDKLRAMCKCCMQEYQREYSLKRKVVNKKTPTMGDNYRKVYNNPDLAVFTPKQLMDELRSRGYTGELKYVQVIKI